MHVRCDKCDGDGHYVVESGAWFSSAAEQYYPSEKVVACDECNGAGWMHADEEDAE
jgi:DnaJ-class molecular chaperone